MTAALPSATASRASWFGRFLLPAFAFKAVVIGGGYATGRELAQFFAPVGPVGGLLGMAVAAVLWSVVCAATFVFARRVGALDYQGFFRALLGRWAWTFEIAYLALLVVILAVFGAAAGAIGAALFAAPALAGTLVLMALIGLVAAFGNQAVERLFTIVSIFLYATYALFLALCLMRFGPAIGHGLESAPAVRPGWILGGLTYAGYNIIGAVVILPVTRRFASDREAVAAGLLCGPLAMAPAVLFFVCMMAGYPAIAAEALPSDALLRRLGLPAFRLIFQAMIFCALLESGTGLVHAVNERIARTWRARAGRDVTPPVRLAIALALLGGSIFLASRFGLVALIARGYGALSWVILAIYVAPLLTVGLWRLLRDPAAPSRSSVAV